MSDGRVTKFKNQRSEKAKMKSVTKILLAALALSTAIAAPASATDYSVLARSGYWTAYSMIADGGVPSCGMRAGTSDRSVYVKWFAGSPNFTVQLFKSTWRIPEGQKISLSLTFDRDEFGSTDNAGGSMIKYSTGGTAGVVDFIIRTETLGTFVEQFAHADNMFISFPASNEAPWRVDMTGSRDVSNAFVSCMHRTRVPTQPYGNPPISSQPFKPDVKPDSNKLPTPTLGGA